MLDNEKAARQKRLVHGLMWVILLVMFISFIFPFVLVVINVFKTKGDITKDPLALIGEHGFTLQNFPEAMEKMNFGQVFMNSTIITVSATILTILVSSMMAFVIVRNGKWKICTLMFSMMIAISVTSWVSMARQVRAQVMSLKEMEFSLAAKVIGCSDMRILLRHLVINALGPIIVCLTMMVPSAIFTESSLSFIGIGISAPQCSLGTLANEARQLIYTQPLQVVWPILAIGLTTLSLNFIGDGVGEALEPKR